MFQASSLLAVTYGYACGLSETARMGGRNIAHV